MPMSTSKKRLNVCVLGHANTGKTTLLEKLTQSLTAPELGSGDKPGKAAADGKDKEAAERKRGVIINYDSPSTSDYDLTLTELSAENDTALLKLVHRTPSVDVAVVLISATERVPSPTLDGVLVRQLNLLRVLGCHSIILCINKLDRIEPNKRSALFDSLSEKANELIKAFHPDGNPIVLPISAYLGSNIVSKGEKYNWFEGSKRTPASQPLITLEDALNFQVVADHTMKPFRMPISGVHHVPGVGTVYAGRIASGVAMPNLKVVIQPCDVHSEIKSIEVHRMSKDVVKAGVMCGVVLKHPSKGDLAQIRSGSVLSADDNAKVKVHTGALAQFIVLNKPSNLSAGYIPMMDLGFQKVATKIAKIVSKETVDNKTVQEPESVGNGEVFVGVVVPQKKTTLESITDFPALAKFTLLDSGAVVAVGSILKPLTGEELLKQYGIHTGLTTGDVENPVGGTS